MTTYTIESGFGDQLAAGIQTETEAARNAQRIADQTGRTVYWGEDRDGGEMHEVNPARRLYVGGIDDGVGGGWDAGGRTDIWAADDAEAVAAWRDWAEAGDYPVGTHKIRGTVRADGRAEIECQVVVTVRASGEEASR